MLLSMNITVTEIFMKTYDYRGSVIKEGNKTTSIAYVQCQIILINTSVPGVSERIC